MMSLSVGHKNTGRYKFRPNWVYSTLSNVG